MRHLKVKWTRVKKGAHLPDAGRVLASWGAKKFAYYADVYRSPISSLKHRIFFVQYTNRLRIYIDGAACSSISKVYRERGAMQYVSAYLRERLGYEKRVQHQNKFAIKTPSELNTQRNQGKSKSTPTTVIPNVGYMEPKQDEVAVTYPDKPIPPQFRMTLTLVGPSYDVRRCMSSIADLAVTTLPRTVTMNMEIQQ